MINPPLHDLLATAKTHFGYSETAPDGVIPSAYLEELNKHILLYPRDTNYCLTLEPRRGYGKVTCLEQGCNSVVIPLIERINKLDGGMAEGFGSLSSYRCHIRDHPTHSAYRDDRIKTELAMAIQADGIRHATSSSTQAVKQERSRVLETLEKSSYGLPGPSSYTHGAASSSSTSPLRHSQAARRSSLVRVKPEPSDATLFLTNSGPLASSSLAPKTPGSTSFTHPRTAKPVYSPVHVKPEPVKSETPWKRLSDVAFGSGAGLNEYGQTLPSAMKRPKFEETLLKKPLYQVERNGGGANIPAAHALPGAVENTRAKIAEVQSRISIHENAVNRIHCKKELTKADARRIKHHQSVVTNLRRLKDKYNASIPNVSPVKRMMSKLEIPAQENKMAAPPIPPAFYNPAYTRPPTVNQPQPVASGSNIRLPDAYDDADMNIDDRDPNNIPAAVLQRIGPAIPFVEPLRGADAFDVNGDFHGRGRDTFVGPQAKADDIDKFLLEAGNAEQFDGNARMDQALEKLNLESQYDLLPGMEVALMPHQTIGVAWMVAKEKSHYKGGCLGDDMGLGKTVQMIATLIKNPSDIPMCKTNLIITPTALLDQWKLEIEMKTNCNLQILIYHGSSKPKRKQDLLRYDVVLTTYSTMALEWPDFENEMKKKANAKRNRTDGFVVPYSDDEANGRPKRKEPGLLFQVDFYRIILDEAQAIRNKRTRTSRAVTSLQSVYRWCLTGTPIINTLVDVYGYLRFLKIRPWYDFQEFQSHVGKLEKKNPTLAAFRLQTIISTFLLRRMKDSKLDGKRLIELPDKTISLVRLQFSDEERDIYNMVEAGAQARFNRYLRAGTVLKNYTQVLVLLLRLRQICSHPSLIQEGGAAFVSPDEVDNQGAESGTKGELARARRMVSAEFVTKMRSKFKAAALQRIAAEKEASIDAALEEDECPICFDVLTDAVITPCTHVFCRECLVDVLNTPMANAPEEPAKYKANERPCPTCRSAICSEKLFIRAPFLPSDADLLPGADNLDVEMGDETVPLKDRKGKGKARPKRLRRRVGDSDDIFGSEPESSDDDEDDAMSDFIVEGDEDEEEMNVRRNFKRRVAKQAKNVVVDSDDEMEELPEEREVMFGKKPVMSSEAIKPRSKFLPSTKMKSMMERLTKLVEERPEEKTLVVSQWTGCLSLVSDYLTEKGVIHVKYQGDMNRAKRDQAVRVFMSKDKARVMLMSLKCGGVGLNLTRANNVISLDLGWSQAIEAQAFDRVHRLGQTRPVVVQRLVISNTVEDRVLAMQERKQLLADGSLGEGAGKKMGRLSVRELANLFGLDHHGHRLIPN